MWQACPICKGTGLGFDFVTKCTVCAGKKIISELTGQPPVDKPGYDLTKTDTTNGNFISS